MKNSKDELIRIRHWLERMELKGRLTFSQKKFAELMIEHGYSYNCLVRHVKKLHHCAQAQRSYERLKAGKIHGRVGLRGIQVSGHRKSHKPAPVIASSKEVDWPVYDEDNLTTSRANLFSKQEMITMLSISEVIPTLMRTQLIAILAE